MNIKFTKMENNVTSRLFILLFVSLSGIAEAQVSLSSLSLPYGDYEVGFRHYVSLDSSRSYKRLYDWNNSVIPREIPVSIWYPSASADSSGSRMSVLDYMEILKQEEEWEYLPNEQILNWFDYSNTPENREHLSESVHACLNVDPAQKKFPVIVYAPSYHASSIENFALCEFLASHGYVIISSPSRGTETRFMEGETAKDMETQARDIEFLINEISGKEYADSRKIATMGFSFGGLSNVLAQMRNNYIKAVVSLDGSIKYKFPTLLESPFADLEKVDVPFIHMAQKDIPMEVMLEDDIDTTLNNTFEFYDSLANSQAYSLKFHHLTHSYFSSLGILFETRDPRQDKSDDEIMESYKWLSIYSLNFLDAYLKDKPDGLAFIENEPAANDVPDGLITKKSKAPAEKEFTFEDFHELAVKQEYQDLNKLYQSVAGKYPSFRLEEGKLNKLGLQLLFNPETSEYGIKVLILATELFPGSANLYDSLAVAYLFAGNKALAIENFEKSLELNPKNQHAVDRLQELKQ